MKLIEKMKMVEPVTRTNDETVNASQTGGEVN